MQRIFKRMCVEHRTKISLLIILHSWKGRNIPTKTKTACIHLGILYVIFSIVHNNVLHVTILYTEYRKRLDTFRNLLKETEQMQ